MVVMDLYSRMIIGWPMKTTLAKEIVLDVLLMAIWRRTPKHEVAMHSDQGCQFTSEAFADALRDHGIKISMDGKGRWVDNVFVERLWRSLKPGTTSVITATNCTRTSQLTTR